MEIKDRGTADIYNGIDSKAARRTLPSKLRQAAIELLDRLDSAHDLRDMANIPGNKLHALKRDRKGQHAVSINEQYRICFSWTDRGPVDVEITDYH